GATRCLRRAGISTRMLPAAEAVASPLRGFWMAILHPIGRGDFLYKSHVYNMLRVADRWDPIGCGAVEALLRERSRPAQGAKQHETAVQRLWRCAASAAVAIAGSCAMSSSNSTKRDRRASGQPLTRPHSFRRPHGDG